jgi:anhydro-N-acetylmuramic acid kinase
MAFDRNGTLAGQGQVSRPLLDWLMALPYLQQKPPKTTGRELFTAAFAQETWRRGETLRLSPTDIIATLTAYTAQSIAHAYQTFLPAMPDEAIVSGGGALNSVMMSMLAAALAPARVMSSDAVGIPVAAKESLAFALLAYESWYGRSGNLPAATGAHKRIVLGHLVQ